MLLRDRSYGRGRRLLAQAVVVCAIAIVAAMGIPFALRLTSKASTTPVAADKPPLSVADFNSIDVPPDVVELAGIRTAVATHPTLKPTLRMRGNLMIDVNRFSHAHSRFPGQVQELATVEEPGGPGMPPKRRPISFMDRVTEGQVLAVVWSKDLGEKKSELAAALATRRLDSQALDRLEALYQKGATTERQLRDAEKQVELDDIAVNRVESTLRTWRLTEQEIADVRKLAEKVQNRKDLEANANDANWARVEIVAPISGTIVEKNVVQGNMVDTDDDLFKIADLSTLTAWAHVYEDDLPYLQKLARSLAPRPVPWTITVSSDPQAGPIAGTIGVVGEIIDPYEHMALVTGQVNNPKGDYLAGEFITAEVELPPEQNIVEIPTRALVEDGDESVVLVQTDPKRDRFVRRRVFVTRRWHDFVHIRSQLTPEQKEQGFEELHEGERVVAAGALELKEALQQQQLNSAVRPHKGTKAPKP